jgi:hypothetical protein
VSGKLWKWGEHAGKGEDRGKSCLSPMDHQFQRTVSIKHKRYVCFTLLMFLLIKRSMFINENLGHTRKYGEDNKKNHL